MRIRNVSGDGREPVDPRLPDYVGPGEEFEVDDPELAEALLAQPATWAEVAAKGGKAAKTDAPAGADEEG